MYNTSIYSYGALWDTSFTRVMSTIRMFYNLGLHHYEAILFFFMKVSSSSLFASFRLLFLHFYTLKKLIT